MDNINPVALVGATIFAALMFVLLLSVIVVDYARKRRIFKKIREGTGRTVDVREAYYPPAPLPPRKNTDEERYELHEMNQRMHQE